MSALEPVYRSRPGAEDIEGANALAAEQVHPGIWMSPGLSNSFLITTTDGRIVVNTGMAFEAPVHRANYDAVDTSPIHSVIFTQGHYDHVGGVDVLRDPGTEVIAQANWADWRRDNETLAPFRASNAGFAWAAKTRASAAHTVERFGGPLPTQGRPEPTLVFDDSLELSIGGRRLELISTPGAETTDSLVIWLPDEGVCLCGNVFGALFGHIPNLVTLRGDRYRDVGVVIDTFERIRSLGAEVLLPGHFGPITGRERIDWEISRMCAALTYIHDETVKGMNAGVDVQTLMREVTLPPELEVGEGYGKVSWNVRAIWENYAGWFHHRSTTELYPFDPLSVTADLYAAVGVEPAIKRAEELLLSQDSVRAIALAESVLAVEPENPRASSVLVEAHRRLLSESSNFWESAWLNKQIEANS
ncbi:MBL fold metallo-hydrolase [Gordonia McavH-238-E]|uniref:MBL fold metallo-hydrolase n=1 Tax=Gordonia sp. McavH-238-E TaxID=2917736 RepID=UPI001EF6B0EE|nr:MBL fold metallo-hydrolase [Gordonia sp. McavH-238-E]MCG7631802.1 MBL fold metallo-hydrolase [Gordonia sp. McavH-238-E]